jgi:hypothetical protein
MRLCLEPRIGCLPLRFARLTTAWMTKMRRPQDVPLGCLWKLDSMDLFAALLRETPLFSVFVRRRTTGAGAGDSLGTDFSCGSSSLGVIVLGDS